MGCVTSFDYTQEATFTSSRTLPTGKVRVVIVLSPRPPPSDLDVFRGLVRAAIARRNARRSNLRSLRNMTHWRRRRQAWRYLR